MTINAKNAQVVIRAVDKSIPVISGVTLQLLPYSSAIGVTFLDVIFRDSVNGTFNRCMFGGCSFTECDMQSSMFENCVFDDCRFVGADMRLATFIDCVFRAIS